MCLFNSCFFDKFFNKEELCLFYKTKRSNNRQHIERDEMRVRSEKKSVEKKSKTQQKKKKEIHKLKKIKSVLKIWKSLKTLLTTH